MSVERDPMSDWHLPARERLKARGYTTRAIQPGDAERFGLSPSEAIRSRVAIRERDGAEVDAGDVWHFERKMNSGEIPPPQDDE